MLTPMPKFGDFREIEQTQARSYLFNGPVNTVREGGPVFVAYGRLLVGSHVIQTSMDNVDTDAEIKPLKTWGLTKRAFTLQCSRCPGLSRGSCRRMGRRITNERTVFLSKKSDNRQARPVVTDLSAVRISWKVLGHSKLCRNRRPYRRRPDRGHSKRRLFLPSKRRQNRLQTA